MNHQTKAPPALLQPLLDALRHPDDLVRAAAAAALGKFGSLDVVEPLVNTLSDPALVVREHAARGLALTGAPAAGALLDLVQSPPLDGARALAGTALGLLRDPNAVDLLCAALTYPEPEARLGAAKALGEIQDLRALPALAEAARHAHPPTRSQACQALGRLGLFDLRILKAAAALLRDEDWQLRAVAVETIGGLVRLLPERLAPHGPDPENHPLNEDDLVLEVLQPLLTALQDPLPDIRYRAAEALYGLHHPAFLQPVLNLMATGSAWVRQVAAEILGGIKAAPETRAMICATLYQVAYDDTDSQVRIHAAQSLVRQGDERGRGLLLRPLKAPNTLTRQAAGIALGHLGELQAIETLLESLEEKNAPGQRAHTETPEGRYLRRRTVAALAAPGQPAIPTLLKALSNPAKDVQKAAYQALVKIGNPAVEALTAALAHPGKIGEQIQIVQALGQIGDVHAVPALEQILRRAVGGFSFLQAFWRAVYDPDVALRIEAASALAEIGSANATAGLLLAARYDPDKSVRRRAGRALAWIASPQAVTVWAGQGPYTSLRRALVGLAWLLAATTLSSALLAGIGLGEYAYLAGVILGAGYGFSGGWEARRQVVQKLALGALPGASVVVLVVSLLYPQTPPPVGVVLGLMAAWLIFPITTMLRSREQVWLAVQLAGLFAGIIGGFIGSGLGAALALFAFRAGG